MKISVFEIYFHFWNAGGFGPDQKILSQNEIGFSKQLFGNSEVLDMRYWTFSTATAFLGQFRFNVLRGGNSLAMAELFLHSNAKIDATYDYKIEEIFLQKFQVV